MRIYAALKPDNMLQGGAGEHGGKTWRRKTHVCECSVCDAALLTC